MRVYQTLKRIRNAYPRTTGLLMLMAVLGMADAIVFYVLPLVH
jgi:hypothetical protein